MTPRPSIDLETCCVDIRRGFLERPGLRVTLQEAQDLWALGPPLCEQALRELLAEGFLVRTIDDQYCRPAYATCPDACWHNEWDAE
jgi:hypothetical protein